MRFSQSPSRNRARFTLVLAGLAAVTTLVLTRAEAAPSTKISCAVTTASSTASTVAKVAKSAPKIGEVSLIGPRMQLSDLVPGIAPELAAIDLGLVPPVSGVRLVTKSEMSIAIAKAGEKEPKNLPEAVRVIRSSTQLSAKDLEALVRKGATGLRKGATITAVKGPKLSTIAAGYDAVDVVIPKIPRKAGPLTSIATVSFRRGTELLGHVMVPIDLVLGPECAVPDVAVKAIITLLVRRGGIEISAPAIAQADADIGETVPVLVQMSGKIVKARVVSSKQVTNVEES